MVKVDQKRSAKSLCDNILARSWKERDLLGGNVIDNSQLDSSTHYVGVKHTITGANSGLYFTSMLLK